jgi:hypothetical protein
MPKWWKWVGLGGSVAAALVCYALCSAGHHDRPPGDHGSYKNDEHKKWCEQRHKPFPARVPPRSPGKSDADDKSGPGVRPRSAARLRSDDQPGLAGPSHSASQIAAAVQPLGGLQAGDDDDDDDNPPATNLTGECPTNGCGLNGTWLGSGVPFRTLHLSRYRHNDVNLSVLGFVGPDQKPLELGVDGDVLHAQGSKLVQDGSVLLLGPPETPFGPPSVPTYAITIKSADTEDFWVKCDSTNPAGGCADKNAHVYRFEATSLTDDCPVQVCKPGLDPESDATNNLRGTAVIFRGDFYDAAYTVRTTPPSDYDDDVFNIACMGTDISKLHLLRHTSASQAAVSEPLPPPVDKRQALLRMLTADYCGAGHPFTQNGVPFRFGFDLSAGYDGSLNPSAVLAPSPDPNTGISLTTLSSYSLVANGGIDTIDGAWNGNGATCIGTPRLARLLQPAAVQDLWTRITATCRAVNHPVTLCGSAPPTLQPPFASRFPVGSYAISQVPPST